MKRTPKSDSDPERKKQDGTGLTCRWPEAEAVAGYGPYCLERWVKGDEFVVRANGKFYRGKPAIDRVVMKKVPQVSNRVVTLKSGQAGLIQGLTPRDKAALRGARGVTVGGVYGNEALFIAPNLNSELWRNKLVREAGAYGIDYAQLLQTVAGARLCQMTRRDQRKQLFRPAI